jgi:hypothetical protein
MLIRKVPGRKQQAALFVYGASTEIQLGDAVEDFSVATR